MGANMNSHVTRQIQLDAKKHSSFLTMLSVASDLRRYAKAKSGDVYQYLYRK
jgi:hypothetical protein